MPNRRMKLYLVSVMWIPCYSKPQAIKPLVLALVGHQYREILFGVGRHLSQQQVVSKFQTRL